MQQKSNEMSFGIFIFILFVRKNHEFRTDDFAFEILFRVEFRTDVLISLFYVRTELYKIRTDDFLFYVFYTILWTQILYRCFPSLSRFVSYRIP